MFLITDCLKTLRQKTAGGEGAGIAMPLPDLTQPHTPPAKTEPTVVLVQYSSEINVQIRQQYG